jgi:hypothetical protein
MNEMGTNIEDLRNAIWEHLFQAKEAKSIDEIAAATNCNVGLVGAAVNHEWFNVTDRSVSIAYVSPNGNRR